MKKSYIVALVVIAVAVGVILSLAGSTSSYVTFGEAYSRATSGDASKVHVVGELKKDVAGEILGIHPSGDKLSFTFLMVDENGQEQKVFYNEPMPPDFQRSEKVVVIGNYNDELFVASKILMKCPSKYQEQTLEAEL